MRFATAWVSVLIVFGCSTQPKAPALIDEPVYENDQEGIRFLVPEGWSLRGKSTLPPGPVTRERQLVEYRYGAATFELSRYDLPDDKDVIEHLSAPSFGAKRWTLKTPSEDLLVGELPARRLVLGGKVAEDELIKEVVVVQRGPRYYFLTGLYWAKDAQSRDQVRRTVGSTIWRQ